MADEILIAKYVADTKTLDAQVDSMGGKMMDFEKKAKKSTKEVAAGFKELENAATKANGVLILENALKGANSMAALKKVMKEATSAALTMKEGTAEYQKFIKIAAEAKEEITQMNQRIKTLRPEEKAAAFRALGQTVIGSFHAAAGAVAVFTGENEELNNLLVKSMAVVNALEGVQAIVDAKKQARNIAIILGLKGEAAAKAENVVVDGEVVVANEAVAVSEEAVKKASPWGWITLGITALVGAVAILYNKFSAVADVVDFLATPFRKVLQFIGLMDSDEIRAMDKSFKELKVTSELYQGTQEQAIRKAELEGKSIQEINKLTKELLASKWNLLAAEHNLLAAKIKDGSASEKEIQRQHEINVGLQTIKNDALEADKKVSDEKTKIQDEENKKIDEIAAESYKKKKAHDDEVKRLEKLRLEVHNKFLADGLADQTKYDDADKAAQELKRDEELAATEKWQEDLVKIHDKHVREVEKINDDAQDAQRKKDDEANEEKIKKAEETNKRIQDATIGLAGQTLSTISDMQHGANERELQDLDEKLKNKSISQKQYDEQVKALKHKQDVQDQQAALFKIALDTAIGVSKAVAESPVTFGLPFSAFVLATGLLQAGAVLSHPLPKYAKGTKYVEGADGVDKVPAWLTKGEAIIPVDANRKHSNFVEAMINGRFEDEVAKTYNIPAILEHKNKSTAEAMLHSMMLNSQFDDTNIVAELKRSKKIELGDRTIDTLASKIKSDNTRRTWN